MFTGIIEEIGKIKEIVNKGKTLELNISAAEITSKINNGDSIAVNGVCLTVTYFDKSGFRADVSPETYKITNLRYLKFNDSVNLETALTLSKPLGGHIVSGHVDKIAKILKVENITDFIKITVEIPAGLRKYMIQKGSIAVDGISLTINEVSDNSFNLMIIPHTLKNTTLLFKKVGDYVNLEVDIVGKYVENFLKFNENKGAGGITEDFLRKHGF
jgi:riboflavin synthase